MNDSDHLLAAMPVPRAFFKLAAPAVAAQIINILYNLVDKMFIGRIPEVGKQALAGVGCDHAGDSGDLRLCSAGQHGRRTQGVYLARQR